MAMGKKEFMAALVIVLVGIVMGLVYLQLEIETLKSPQTSPSPSPTIAESPSPSILTPTPTSAPTPSPSPTPTSSPEATTVLAPTPLHIGSDSAVYADIFVTPIGGNELSYLLITGNVTNNSPNTLHDVGLHIYSFGYPFIGPNEETLINTTVPISSGSYGGSGQPTLSILSPHESVSVNIQVHSMYEYRSPILYGNEVKLVWTS